MGAHVDQTSKAYFDVQYRKYTANNIGAACKIPNEGLSHIDSRALKGDSRKSWSVCHHLSTFEGLIDYYITNGSIMLLLGKCFCQDCCETILSQGDLNEFIQSCDHLTDREFQEELIYPLYRINREAFRTRKSYVGKESTRWTWISCPHIANENELEKIYLNCDPIFLSEGFVTCKDCLNMVPSSSIFMQALLECEPMTDEQLQQRVIDQLYPINHYVLEAVGHYDRQI